MRVLACSLLVTAAAAAEERRPHDPPQSTPHVSVGAGMSLEMERNSVLLYTAQVAVPVRDYWIEAAVGIGAASLRDPSGSGQGASTAYEGRVGLARMSCGARACGGIVGSIGYHHQAIDFEDGLAAREMWTEVRDLAFAEVRAVGRLRFGPAALEAALGGRFHATLHHEETRGGIATGLIASLGLTVTL